MWKDPIVEDVRKNAAEIEKQVHGDRLLYIQRLQENQRKSGRKVVSFSGRRTSTAR